MKNLFLVSSVALYGVTAFAAMEAPLSGVYAPTYGYDNNDSVEVVFEGNLPNACYSLAGDIVRVDDNLKTIYIGELITRLKDGVCAQDDDALPTQARSQVHFERNVTIGTLSAGKYQIIYTSTQGLQTRALDVAVSPVSNSVDSNRYAMISNAFVATQVESSEETFEVRLTGAVGSSCTILKDIQVTLENDVFVLLPITETSDEICMPSEVPFYRIINLKTPVPGRYLLHTRSIGGGSKNSLFTVR